MDECICIIIKLEEQYIGVNIFLQHSVCKMQLRNKILGAPLDPTDVIHSIGNRKSTILFKGKKIHFTSLTYILIHLTS